MKELNAAKSKRIPHFLDKIRTLNAAEELPGQVGIWQVLHHCCGETDALGEKNIRYSSECSCNKCQHSCEQLFPSKRWQHMGENKEIWNICWLLITWRNMPNQKSESCYFRAKPEISTGEEGKVIFTVARTDLYPLPWGYFIHKIHVKEMLIKEQY